MPVMANDKPHSAMSYTTVSKTPTKSQPQEDNAHDKPDSLVENPANKVWNRYKALAAGTFEEDTPTSAPDDTKKAAEDANVQTAKTEPAAAPTGFAGILQEYQKNKKQRSQMHSLTVQKP